MTETLAFDHLVKDDLPQLAALPDYRTGKNTQYAIKMRRWVPLLFLTPVALLFGLSADDATG